jgi:TonB family protein
MFDLIAAGPRHPFHNPTVAPQLLSVTVHGIVLSAAILIPLLLASEKLPVVPTMMAFVASPVAPPPPPPPPAPKAAARAPEARPQPTATSSPNAAPQQPVRIGGQISAPELLHRVEPVYPDIAVMAKVTGTVILEAVVATDGTVESVKVLRPVKFLDQAAIDAVKQWRYKPLILNGMPTPFVLTVTLTFSIR